MVVFTIDVGFLTCEHRVQERFQAQNTATTLSHPGEEFVAVRQPRGVDYLSHRCANLASLETRVSCSTLLALCLSRACLGKYLGGFV
jgi:hypothetical protein